MVGLRHQSIRQPPHLLCCPLSVCVSASHLAIPRTSRKCVLWQGQGEGEGSPVGWNLSPTIPSLLSPTPPKEGCCCWRSSLNSPTYSPRSSSSPLTLPLLPIQAVATSSVITQAPHIQFPGHHDAHLCIVPPPRCPAQPQPSITSYSICAPPPPPHAYYASNDDACLPTAAAAHQHQEQSAHQHQV